MFSPIQLTVCTFSPIQLTVCTFFAHSTNSMRVFAQSQNTVSAHLLQGPVYVGHPTTPLSTFPFGPLANADTTHSRSWPATHCGHSLHHSQSAPLTLHSQSAPLTLQSQSAPLTVCTTHTAVTVCTTHNLHNSHCSYRLHHSHCSTKTQNTATAAPLAFARLTAPRHPCDLQC